MLKSPTHKTTQIALMILALTVAPSLAFGRQRTLGTLTGAVSDFDGARFPGATITLKNETTGVTQSKWSDDRGVFTFVTAPGSNYTLTVEFNAFKTKRIKNVQIPLGSPAQIEIKMEFGLVHFP